MPSLADTQARMRAAVVTADAVALAGLRTEIRGGRDPLSRLSIFRRHYRASLIEALHAKFAATLWLLGPARMEDVASDFVAAHPPTAPCIAEYGAGFPAFLAAHPTGSSHPYAADLARLDWLIGKAAIAVAHPPLPIETLAGHAPDALVELSLRLQPGLGLVETSWPVDELARIFLADASPEQIALDPAPTFVEVMGSRGNFQLARREAGAFAFRQALAEAATIGDAAERALAVDHAFDPGAALVALLAEGLIHAIDEPSKEAMS